ncbi:hypothetical protein ACFWPV_10025 [Streptomyces uncialis]|uniref:hypothetical protein n=1 Tax=Streptomyces uncialis TaxID=1048205 RepID=UPI00365F0A14
MTYLATAERERAAAQEALARASTGAGQQEAPAGRCSGEGPHNPQPASANVDTSTVGAATDIPGTVTIPQCVLRDLVVVAAHVSSGRGAADLTPYPDSTARRALGALDHTGHLAVIRRDGAL